MRTHESHAYSLGVSVTYDWFSPEIENVIVAEKQLIAWCEQNAQEQRNSEYFTGLDCHETVTFAETLIYQQ